jgi:hypothetical protein
METQLLCYDCKRQHIDPAVAALGHRVLCLDCQLARDYDVSIRAVDPVGDLAPIAA